jgi:phosphinothricin acetyltransferase
MIRRALAADAPAIAALWNPYGRETAVTFNAVEKTAAGAHQMIAGVSAENPDGIAFHARMGFAEIARVREAGCKFGRCIDLVLMQKFL